MNRLRYVNWLEGEEKLRSREAAGSKGATTGQKQAGVGFSVRPRAYLEFLSVNGLFAEIRDLLAGVDMDAAADLWGRSAAIRQLIVRTELPSQIEQEIIAAYEKLTQGSGGPGCSLSVQSRVMVTAAGQTAGRLTEKFDPYEDILGSEQLIVYVKRCWARLWTPRALYCRQQLECPHLDVLPVVTVAKIPAKEAAIA